MQTKNLTLVDVVIPRLENRISALAKDAILVLGFAVLTAVCAKLKIEIGAVPVTMQTFAVLLAGAVLGSRRGALSQLSYLAMGLVGVPWFSRGGGMGYILSPTFGYIVGFVLAAFVIGYLAEKELDRKIKTAILAMFIGSIFLYIPGLLWLAKFVGFGKVLAVGFLPFIIGDILKIILAGLVLPLGWKIINNQRVTN